MGIINYLVEINSFYSWIAYNPLSVQAQSLWHLLMNINNRCSLRVQQNGRAWRVYFTAANTVINNVLGFTNKMQLKRARDELIEAGRIEYTCGTKSQCGTYKMIPFDGRVREGEAEGEKVWITVSTGNDIEGFVTNPLPIPLQNREHYININNKYKDLGSGGMCECMYDEHKEKKLFTAEIQKMIRECWGCSPTEQDYTKALGLITKYDRRERKTYLDSDALGLLEYAFRQSAYYKACNWRYIDGIIQRLRNLGITTADEAEAEDVRRDIEKEGRI
ncbi:MAG: DnaD domain protein [bacterium]|nr:DnaD domain protein [bacterium]